MAHSCQAVAQIASSSKAKDDGVLKSKVATAAEQAFNYGRNLGIAFQIIDDYLDFTASADNLGKPAAADLK